MSPADFRQKIVAYVLNGGFSAWALIANSPKGHMPVGLVLGEMRRRALMLGGIVWFPWASPRNKLEATLTFLNGMRDDLVILEWAPFEQRKSWEHICRYGVMRRIGMVYDMAPDPLALFQSRKR